MRTKRDLKKFNIISLASVVTLSALLFNVKVFANKTFSDVSESSWYYEAVSYVKDNNIMNGMTDDTFEPQSKVTRAMVVTIFYNIENKPNVTYKNYFTDVNESNWYSSAVTWAKENNIVSGYSDNTFKPNNLITMEELSSIILNYDKKKELYNEDYKKSEIKFNDENEIGMWAKDAISYMAYSELLKGDTEGNVGPKKNTTRAEIATVFMRYDKRLKNIKLEEEKKLEEAKRLEEEKKKKEEEEKKKAEEAKSAGGGGGGGGGSSAPSEIKVSSVSFNNKNVTLVTGEKTTIPVIVTPSNAKDKTLTYESNNENVTVTSSGEITAVTKGEAIVTVKSSNGKTDTLSVSVLNPEDVIEVTSITAPDSAITLGVYETYTISATITPSNATFKNLTYEVNNDVCSVSSSGVIKGLKEGTSQITIKAKNGVNLAIDVTVIYNDASFNAVTSKITEKLVLDETSDLTKKENSFSEYNSTGLPIQQINFAKNIWDLETYDNKVFIGTGDYDKNAGPVPVYYYDNSDGLIKKASDVDGEQVSHFEIIDDNLFIPDFDPHSVWGKGYFYKYDKEAKTFSSKFTVANAVHDFDIAKHDDKYFLSVASLKPEETSMVVYTTDGTTYTSVPFYRNGENLEEKYNFVPKDTYYNDADKLYAYLRAYNLWEFNGKLYCLVDNNASNSKYTKEDDSEVTVDAMGIYVYDDVNNKFVFDEDLYLSPYNVYKLKDDAKEFLAVYNASGVETYLRMDKKLTYNNNFVFVSYGRLKKTSDMKEVTTIFGNGIAATSYARDMKVIGDTLYVLVTKRINDTEYVSYIYETKDLENFKLLYEIPLSTYIRSFEIVGDKLVLGTGTPYRGNLYEGFFTAGGGNLYIYGFDK